MAGGSQSVLEIREVAGGQFVDTHRGGRFGEARQQRFLRQRIQPYLRLRPEIADMLTPHTGGIEVTAVRPMVQIQPAGEHPGLHGAEHPAVGLQQAPREHPAVNGLEYRLPGGLGRVELGGETPRHDAQFRVVDHRSDHRDTEVSGQFEQVTT